MVELHVDRDDHTNTRLVTHPPRRELDEGQIRLAIERFALTSNNISYAVSGDMLGYWDFFPTGLEGWGRLPVGGVGVVVESDNDDIAVGGRYLGMFTMAAEVTIDAEASGSGFRDVGAHRAGHAPFYVGFRDVGAGTDFPVDLVDEHLLLSGLHMTSFLIDDFLAEHDHFGADQVIVTSASSKTAIALAFCAAGRHATVTGLTSGRNRDFVDGLGLYDDVVTYDEIDDLDESVVTVVVDIAGNADVLHRLHDRFGERLAHSAQVGATHWDAGGGPRPANGPRPEFFFAPGRVQQRSSDWGPAELQHRLDGAFTAFAADASRWLDVRHGAGPDAVRAAYHEVLGGESPPPVGHILTMADAIASPPSN